MCFNYVTCLSTLFNVFSFYVIKPLHGSLGRFSFHSGVPIRVSISIFKFLSNSATVCSESINGKLEDSDQTVQMPL